MSEESTPADLVELTRSALEAANRHDLDALMGCYASDAVWDLSDVGIGSFEGVAAIRSFVEDWWGTWADHRMEVEEILDLGQGVVYSPIREDGRLVDSDSHVEQRRGFSFVWSRGVIERQVVYFDIDEARAAGERLAESRAAMSQDGLEIVKRGIAAYNTGDMDAMMRTYAADVKAFPDASAFPDAHPCHGRAEFRAWLEESATAWAKPSWVVTEVLVVDSERVLLRGNWGGQGVSSGLAAAASITGIFVVRDARISRVEFFLDHQKALSAVGLAG